jgi:hypothetical protein
MEIIISVGQAFSALNNDIGPDGVAAVLFGVVVIIICLGAAFSGRR